MTFKSGPVIEGEMAPVSRRVFMVGLGAVTVYVLGHKLRATTLPAPLPAQSVLIEQFSAGGESEGTVTLPKVVKSASEWRAQLGPSAFRVTREAGTEMPFSGQYASTHADGIYRCVCCGTALYDSKTKFESGTGWPSFWRPISRVNVVNSADSTFGMQRDAVSCRLCDAHLGHVFEDGPQPTGLRYCMNSESLHFVPRG